MRILVTGSREWGDRNAIGEALYAEINKTDDTEIVIVHGACPSGADRMAADFCESEAVWFEGGRQSLAEERHPANWRDLGKRAGFVRNEHMVDLGADVCLAFIRNGSRGALHTAALAEKAGIPVRRWTA